MNWQDEIIKRVQEPLAPIFKDMKQQYNLRLDKDLLQRLKDRAQSEGTSVTELIEHAVNIHLGTGICTSCRALVPETMLEENCRYASYGFGRICDNCSDVIDKEQP
jgi:hypothetical protein